MDTSQNKQNNTNQNQPIPKKVFIVPYRNRHQHKYFFSTYLSNILKNDNDYEIYFSHQCDSRSFNRGATKNIGFLAIKEKYPNDYKEITFIFNDIDTIPFNNIFHFETEHGSIKHFYGFKYALGGIVAVKGGDFEATNGYPNFWGWGMEDTVLQKRCEQIGLKIDRSEFFPIGSPQIIHLFDGVTRLINTKDPIRATNDNSLDGVRSIHKLDFSIDKESTNPIDNINVYPSNKIFIINIKMFLTAIKFENDHYYDYDIREPSKKITNPNNSKIKQIQTITSSNQVSSNNWETIPFYPTLEKRKEMIHLYGKENADKIIEYSYKNSKDPNVPVIPPEIKKNMNNNYSNNNTINNNKIQNGSKNLIIHSINKYSSSYASYIGQKPKATTSVNIGLGGIAK